MVLNLGLMYHISKHVQLLELISACASDVVVTDTEVAIGMRAYMSMKTETTDEPRNAVDHELVFVPSRKVVVALMRQFGFETVTLRPRFGSWDFRLGRRRAFISSRTRALDGLDVEPISVSTEMKGVGKRAVSRAGQVRRLLT